MKNKWIIKTKADLNKVEYISTLLNIDTILSTLLVHRGIENFEQAKTFFRPNINDLHDPFLMKDIDLGVNRIEKAIKNNEKILIYGDYDVDGTTSVALVYLFLSNFYNNIDFYVPDRYKEGYGISLKGIDYASENNISLIIALDCGIKAVDEIKYANKKNIDFIICDHHTQGNIIPEAIAVIDPKQKNCNYPYKELSGCGVGYKLLQAYSIKNNIPNSVLNKYIDLVLVSIASDIVPITGENRILAFWGLKKINANPLIGLKSLIDISQASDKEISISDCVFKIGPRINAAGRIKSARSAIELLISENKELANEIAETINQLNTERKELDKKITEEALEIIISDDKLIKQKTTVLYKNDWHKGVIGIVASRLIETYHRPTIVLTESKGMLTGSARSVYGFDLYNAIDSCNELLESFGGHMYAAGLTLKLENFEKFKTKFEKVVSETITPEQLIPKINIDASIDFNIITPKFYRILKQFAPFGPENMSPVFMSKNVKDTGYSKIVGATKEHLKLDVKDVNNDRISGIGFSFADYYPIVSKSNFDICYAISENEYMGLSKLQLMVKDIKVSETE